MNKKTYSLALGGGAARGFAHIGVIKYLEENEIEINEISGNSMGAIVGAMYSIGLSSSEMIKIIDEIKIYKLADFNFKKGFFDGKKILKKLEEIFKGKNIEDCMIKLKIVATNLESGEMEVFTTGKISDAIRASISLPSIMVPHKIGDNQYVDGGITCNLPIEVLEGKNIIAVSALKKLSSEIKTKKKFLGFEVSRSFLEINYRIIHRSIVIMMRQNEKRSLATPGKKIIYLLPDFGDLDYYSFDKLDEMVKVGYEEAEEKMK